jgi:hypothetical protein
MECIQYRDLIITYYRQGNTKNGNAIYILNFFNASFINSNYKIAKNLNLKLDKKNNIKWIKDRGITFDTHTIIDQYLD